MWVFGQPTLTQYLAKDCVYLNHCLLMSCRMTLYIHCYRKACYVAWRCPNMNSDCCCSSTKTHGRYRYLKPVTFNNIHVKNSRRVITCIFPCKGMTDRLPKIAVFVTLPYTLIYCIFQRTIYYGIAAYFNKKYRNACILAHGRIFFQGNLCIFKNLVKYLFAKRRLLSSSKLL